MLSFGKLLELDRSVPMYIKNLQVLPPKMFKINIIQAPPIFNSLFESQNTTCNLQKSSNFSVPHVSNNFNQFFNLGAKKEIWYQLS